MRSPVSDDAGILRSNSPTLMSSLIHTRNMTY